MNFSILGNGFVGNALYEGMKSKNKIKVFDIEEKRRNCSFEESLENEIIFLCVPTPTDIDGKIDISIIKNLLLKIESRHLFVVKSTVTPNAMQQILKLFPNQRFVVNPEFLTERTAVEDFKNPSRIVLGGEEGDIMKIENLYRELFPNVKIVKTDHKTACFIKYFSNCYYAAKISLMNEFKQIADSNGLDWQDSLDGLLSSGWVNSMHTHVPGPDGDLGFGGKCFPKDINALISEAIELDVEPTMLKAAWEKNLQVRTNKDWLKINGAMKE